MKWAVVQFKDKHQSISTIPYSWLIIKENKKMCPWPSTNPRKYISIGGEPNPTWKSYEILTILKEFEDYEEALSFEKKKETPSSESDTDAALISRSGRKTKRHIDEDYEYVGNDRFVNMESPPKLNDSEADTDSFEEDEVLMPPPLAKKIKKSARVRPDKEKVLRNIHDNKSNVPDTEIEIQQENDKTYENVITSNDKDESCTILNINSELHNERYNDASENNENRIQSSNHEVCCKHADILDKIFENSIAIKIILNEQQKTIENVVSNERQQVVINNFDSVPVKPFKKYAKLIKYEENLKNSEEAKKQLETLFYMCGGSDSKESIKRGLAKIFSDNLARKCSLTGRKGNYPVKNLIILSLLKDATRKRFGNLSEKEFEIFTSSWLRQSQLRFDRKNSHKTNEPIPGRESIA